MKYIMSLIFCFYMVTNALSQFQLHGGAGLNLSNINVGDIPEGLTWIKTEAATNYFLSARPELGLTKNRKSYICICWIGTWVSIVRVIQGRGCLAEGRK